MFRMLYKEIETCNSGLCQTSILNCLNDHKLKSQTKDSIKLFFCFCIFMLTSRLDVSKNKPSSMSGF